MVGRPQKYPENRVQMQVRLPKKLRTALQREADRRYVSKCLLVERAIAESLERWKDEELVASNS